MLTVMTRGPEGAFACTPSGEVLHEPSPQEGIHTRVRFHHIGKPHLVLGGKILQRLSVTFRNGDHLILTNQATPVGWQRISYRRGGTAKADNSEGRCE